MFDSGSYFTYRCKKTRLNYATITKDFSGAAKVVLPMVHRAAAVLLQCYIHMEDLSTYKSVPAVPMRGVFGTAAGKFCSETSR